MEDISPQGSRGSGAVSIALHSMAERHPVGGRPLIEQFGPALVLRLGVEPLQLPSGVNERHVTVDRASPRAKKPLEVCAITCENSQEMEDRVLKLRFLRNEQDITEDAAIGVMLLLAHEWEGLTLVSVLPIGSGGDYLMRLPHGAAIQVEVSGIFRDETGHSGKARLKEKCTQVLSKADAGFASVSIFHHRNGLNCIAISTMCKDRRVPRRRRAGANPRGKAQWRFSQATRRPS
jgi:hypothetical protein